MIDTQTAPTQNADEAWLRSLRVTTANSEPVRPSLRRRLVVGSLLGFIVVMVLLVRAELASVPEGAVAGLLLQGQIKMAELTGASGLVVEVEQRPLSMTGESASTSHKARQHRSSRAARRAATPHAIADDSAPVGHLQVLPIRPLQPFSVEVVSGSRHRLFPGTSEAVHVDTSDSESLLPFAAASSASALQASRRGATLRALISAEGRIEDMWVIQGPAPSHAALKRVLQGQYRPFMLNGRPVEMEALIVLDGDSPESARSSF